nr:reticulon-4 receptor [Misgurnus anguillicaudatus]
MDEKLESFSVEEYIFLVISMGASKLCPHQCFCYETSDLVNCQSRGFTHIPHSIPHGTWLLDLGGNKLTELRSTSFTGIWALRVLLIPQSCLQVVHSQALSSLTFLEKLDLSYNELRVLPPDFSEGLTSLKDLRLSHNALERLETHSLQELESLEKLDLSHNHIQFIGVGALRGLARLRHLNLAWNQLMVLQGEMLTMQQGLEVLLLGHNNISKVEAEAFAPLQTLTILNLEANQLKSLKFKIFLNLRTTSTHLQLSENPWTCDCELHRVFSKILRVRHLHVDDYWNITCQAPHLLTGAFLGLMHSQLCIAETATVLVITGTVMVTVVAAMVMAERQRKGKKMNLEKQGSDPIPWEYREK